MSLTERLNALDRRQQRSSSLGFVAAVIKKFGDDGAGQLGALIAYYAFFSLFPLLLVFVTVLGFILQGNPSAQASVLHSTLKQVPILGEQLERNVHSLTGSPAALAIGIAGSLLASIQRVEPLGEAHGRPCGGCARSPTRRPACGRLCNWEGGLPAPLFDIPMCLPDASPKDEPWAGDGLRPPRASGTTSPRRWRWSLAPSARCC